MDFSEIPNGDGSEDDGYENDSDLDILQEIGENLTKFKILCLPYWIRHFEFAKSDFIFVISDVKNL